MRHSIHDTFFDGRVMCHQYNYPKELYESEVMTHASGFEEYQQEISNTMHAAIDKARPNTQLLANQPWLTAGNRYKIIDFLYKLSVRLKMIPYVFCHATRLFDRYASRRILLPEQAQLVAATCLWITGKQYGGNCHFADMSNDRMSGKVRHIQDLGFGSGSRFHGPTQRYRHPRISELIKLCGSRCNYSFKMFVQMEVYVLQSLDWHVTEPGIDDYLAASCDFHVGVPAADHVAKPSDYELRRMKQFVAYASCFSYELIRFDPFQVATAINKMINHTFMIPEHDPRYLLPNPCIDANRCRGDYQLQAALRKFVISATARSPHCLVESFNDFGPSQLYDFLTNSSYKSPQICTARPKFAPPHTPQLKMHTPQPVQYYESPITPEVRSCELSGDSVASDLANDCALPPNTEDADDQCKKSMSLHKPAPRRTFPVLATPVLNSANMNSHQYPPVFPPIWSIHARNNDNRIMLRSINGSREHGIGEAPRAKTGMYTPSSGSSAGSGGGCKDISSTEVVVVPALQRQD